MVGQRIRLLRQELGVSLSELARRAGIGKATLSGLETGTRNPTLETLWAITAQLGVPIAAVLDPPIAPYVVRGTAIEATLLRVFEESDATFELYRMRIPPGIQQTSPAHPKGVSEHITVFSGILLAGPVDEPMTARPGDYISWPAHVPHSYVVLGEAEVHASLLIRYPTTVRSSTRPDEPTHRLDGMTDYP